VALCRELEDLDRQFEAITADTTDLTHGLAEGAFNWRPEPDRWSIAECLSHLDVVGRRYMRKIDAGIASARAKGLTGRGPFRVGLLERWYLRMVEPPPPFRVKAPLVYVPAADPSGTAVLPSFLALQDEFRAQLREADGLDLARARVPSPAYKKMTVGLGTAFAAMAAHERRHLWQARQVRGSRSFPEI